MENILERNERQAHDERIGLLWRQAALELSLGQSSRATLDELGREQDRCAAFGCFAELAQVGKR